MIELKHSLQFVTQVDETHPIGRKLMQVSEAMRTEILESILKEHLLPVITPELAKVNENGSWAILKVAN